MRYTVHIHQRARKIILKLPKGKQKAIISLLESLADNPRPHGCKRLGGKLHELHRLRSGDYLIVYQIKDKDLIVLVLRIGSRGDICKGNINL